MLERFCIGMIWILVLGLLGLGLVMITSTSPWVPEGEDYILLKRQIFFGGTGLVFAVIISLLNYNKYKKFIKFIYIGAIILLLLCYVPGIQKGLNGEFRWIGIGDSWLRFQPSECAKIAVVLALAYWYSLKEKSPHKFLNGFLIPGLILGGAVLLIFFEKDMGTAAALAVAGGCIMFAAGAQLRYMIPTVVLGIAGLIVAVSINANRIERIKAWLDMEAHKLGAGLQQYRALQGQSAGGWTGVGLGNSTEKHGFLPYAHTDFIFAPIGEELGLVASLSVLFAFTFIAIFGILLTLKIRDTFGRIICIGIVFIIFCPAVLNIAVVSALVPNTGLPLPFISYGGTNLFFSLLAIGVLTSVQRWQSVPEKNYIDPLNKRKPTSPSSELSL